MKSQPGELRQPYQYVHVGHFSNRKNRSVEFFLINDADAAFDLQRIAMWADIPFVLGIPDLTHVKTQFPPASALDLCPSKPVEAAGFLRFIAAIDKELDIGRKRPRFNVIFTGCKFWPQPLNVARTTVVSKKTRGKAKEKEPCAAFDQEGHR